MPQVGKAERLYKILGPDRMPCHGGSGQWPPPGEWRVVDGALVPCENGLHLCRAADLCVWMGPGELWEAEADGETVDDDPDKIVARRARLVRYVGPVTREVMVAWAIRCAEDVLPLWERERPHDDRPRRAIEAARSGPAPGADAAAEAAARAAAGYAVKVAAYAAADAYVAAHDGAWDAARGVAAEAALAWVALLGLGPGAEARARYGQWLVDMTDPVGLPF